MPSISAASSRLPPVNLSVSAMNSLSISSSGLPTSDAMSARRLLPAAGRCPPLGWLGKFRRQIVHVQHAVEIDHDHAFDHVAQLAHVARPVVSHQLHPRRGRHAFDLLVMPLGELLDEVLDQQRNILRSLDQPRQRRS